MVGLQACATMPCFLHGFWASSPDPYAGKVETLLTEPSPQALGMFFIDPDVVGSRIKKTHLV